MVRKIKSKDNKKSSGNQGDIIKQAQIMQEQMLSVQEELKSKELDISVGGGAVNVKINGQKQILSIKITDEILKEAVDENDKEMLEDLLVSAISEATRQAEEVAEKEMSEVTGGVNIPGLF